MTWQSVRRRSEIFRVFLCATERVCEVSRGVLFFLWGGGKVSFFWSFRRLPAMLRANADVDQGEGKRRRESSGDNVGASGRALDVVRV